MVDNRHELTVPSIAGIKSAIRARCLARGLEDGEPIVASEEEVKEYGRSLIKRREWFKDDQPLKGSVTIFGIPVIREDGKSWNWKDASP